MIKSVIFDIDQTLYNYKTADAAGMKAVSDYCKQTFRIDNPQIQDYYLKAWHLAEQRIGTDTAAIHNRMIRFQCMMELLEQPLFPHVKNLCETYWGTFLQNMQLSPGIEQFLHKLKTEHIRIGIGTDMTAYIQYQKLEKLALTSYIDFIVTSEEAGTEKPSPGFFHLCVKKSGCQAPECAFIGDNIKKDVNGAIENGLYGIWYSNGTVPDPKMPFPVIVSFKDCL